MSENDPYTYGERWVGYDFNPSNDPTVGLIKRNFADAIDLLNDLRSIHSDRGNVVLMLDHAIKAAIEAQMWAVKAATWRDPLPAWMTSWVGETEKE